MTEFQEMLDFDALNEAEKLTGQSYKEDKFTESLGMRLFFESNQKKNDELSLRDDTHFGITLLDCLRIYADLGFEIIHTHTFQGTAFSSSVEETYRVLWHPAGILAHLESYAGDGVNMTQIYYNWKSEDPYSLISSGRCVDGVLIGYRDVREGLRHYLGRHFTEGEFINPWIETPFLWLVDYSQSNIEGYDHKAITASVIETFPAKIRTAINYTRGDK